MSARQPVSAGAAALAHRILAARTVLGVGGFCLLVALLAQVRVPLPATPVPMTLQLLGVLLAGFFLTPVPAVAAMALYVGVGTFWPPVFTPGSQGLWGLTGGYLVGFVIGAGLVSLVRGRSRCCSLGRLLVAGALGTMVVFGLGIFWQVTLFGFTYGQAFELGVVPFMPKSVIQLGFAVATVRAARSIQRLKGW